MLSSTLQSFAFVPYRRYVPPLFYYCISSLSSTPTTNTLHQQVCHESFSTSSTATNRPSPLAWVKSNHRGHGSTCRWMTTEAGNKNNEPGKNNNDEPGKVEISDLQTALEDIDLDRLQDTVVNIRNWLGYENYDVNLFLVNDDEIQEVNQQSRGVDKPTDILSFPNFDAIEAGVLGKPLFGDIEDRTLGEMLIDVPYIIRTCQQDASLLEEDSDDEWEYDDRGVAPSLEKVSEPETRLHMLIVHGMLHLVGYDHEEDVDYELMVTKEDELLRYLGLPTASKDSSTPDASASLP